MLRFLLTTALLFTAALPVRAAETLTVLTYESFTAEWGPGPAIEKAFEAECGCDLKFVAVGDGVAILNRLKLEGDNTSADMALGLDNNLMAEAQASGLFAPHGQALDKLTLPVAWTDKTFLPFDYAHFAVVYDREKLAAPPKSLDELVNGDPAAKIVIQDPRTSTPGLGLMLWIKAVYGDKAGEAWSKLKRRVLTVTPGWSEAYALFTQGEAPMVLSYTTSPAYHQVAENSDRYAALAFPEGHPLQIEVAAKLAKAKAPALADRFLAFMLTPAFQDHIPTGNWMLPAAATSTPVPAAFATLVKPEKTLDIAPSDIALNRRAWTDEWLAAMGR